MDMSLLHSVYYSMTQYRETSKLLLLYQPSTDHGQRRIHRKDQRLPRRLCFLQRGLDAAQSGLVRCLAQQRELRAGLLPEKGIVQHGPPGLGRIDVIDDPALDGQALVAIQPATSAQEGKRRRSVSYTPSK